MKKYAVPALQARATAPGMSSGTATLGMGESSGWRWVPGSTRVAPPSSGDVFEGDHDADHHRRARVMDAGHALPHVGVPGLAVQRAAGRGDVVGVVDEGDVRGQDLAHEGEDPQVDGEVQEQRVVLQDALDLQKLRDAGAGARGIGPPRGLGRVCRSAGGGELGGGEGVFDDPITVGVPGVPSRTLTPGPLSRPLPPPSPGEGEREVQEVRRDPSIPATAAASASRPGPPTPRKAGTHPTSASTCGRRYR